MRCLRCGGRMTQREETRRSYSGLDDIVVEGVVVRHCPGCGELEVSYPDIEQLQRELALRISEKEAALVPQEIRFLRTQLGLTGAALARRMGVTPETVSRWERVDKPLPMGATAERLLRLMAAGAPSREYPLARLDTVASKEPRALKSRLQHAGSAWHARSPAD